MEEPFFSVLMPVYNGAKYFDRSVKSVLSQSCGDFELLMLDDCSTDDSPERVRELAAADSRVVPLAHEENTGSIGSRIDLIQAAKGRYIVWLDQDDEYASDFLETAYRLIAAGNWDIVHFPHWDKNPDGTVYREGFAAAEKHDEEVLDWFFRGMQGNIWYMWDKVVRTELWRKHLPPRMRCATDDVFFTLPVFFYGRSYLAVDDHPMYTYYRDIGQWGSTGGSLTLDKYKEQVDVFIRFYQYNHDFLRDHGFGLKYEDDLLRFCYLGHLFWRVILLPTAADRDAGMQYFQKYFACSVVPRPYKFPYPGQPKRATYSFKI